MFKVKVSEALTWAQAVGYTGPATDPALIKSHLVENASKLAITNPADGKTVDLKDAKSFDLESDTAPEVKSFTATPATGKTDIAAMVKAQVAEVFKNTEEAKSQRPGGIDPDTKATKVGSVKSGEEVAYEYKQAKKQAVFGDYREAKGFAHMLAAKAALSRHKINEYQRHQTAYLQICEEKGYAENAIATGGALVPEQFDARIVQLIKEYGVARKVCTVVNMTSDSVTRPRVTGDLTLYYPAEGTAGTESSRTFSNVQLKAKKGIALVKMSMEILADAAIDLAEDTARSIARIVAKVEDDTLFNGTGAGAGTSYIPFCKGYQNLFGATATTDTRSQIGGDTGILHTRALFCQTMQKAPRYVGGMAAWHCSYEAGALLLNAALAQGGAGSAEFAGFGVLDTVFNRPVIYNNVMNTTEDVAGDIIDFYFGDISQSAYMGLRGGLEIDTSTERYFDEANIAIRGIVRHDIVVHDLGTTTTQSPVVALWQT